MTSSGVTWPEWNTILERFDRVLVTVERALELVPEILDGLGQVERDDELVLDDEDLRAIVRTILGHGEWTPGLATLPRYQSYAFRKVPANGL